MAPKDPPISGSFLCLSPAASSFVSDFLDILQVFSGRCHTSSFNVFECKQSADGASAWGLLRNPADGIPGRELVTVATETGYTSSSGVALIPCDGEVYQGWFDTDGWKANVLYAGNPAVSGNVDDDCDSPSYVNVDAIYDDEFHLLTQFTNIAFEAGSKFGYGRGPVDVEIHDTTSHYDPNDDWIRLDSVWVWQTGSADWVKALEYGHAYHHIPLGGMPSVPDSCQDHGFMSDEAMECAFVEGWADYFGWSITEAPPSSVESNGFLTDDDGSNTEGPIASFFWDLTDSGMGSHDSVAFPGWYISGILKTCEVDGGSRANGIDHIIYCMENQVETIITSGPDYFPDRDSDRSSYSEGVTEPQGWSWQVIRDLWIEDLYNGG